MIVHNAVLHLHAFANHLAPRHPPKGFCCYIQPQLMNTRVTSQVQVMFFCWSICLYSSMLDFLKQIGTYIITDLSWENKAVQLISCCFLLPKSFRSQCTQKAPGDPGNGKEGKAKKSSDGKECTMLHRWFTPYIYSIPLLYALRGADFTSVSMVLCDLLERASFYFKNHRGEHTSITFYKLPIRKKYPQPNTEWEGYTLCQ